MDAGAAEFILEHVKSRQASQQPLVVGLQGPQGSGKSTLSQSLFDRLAAPPHSLRVAFLSLDDLYSTHAELQKLKVDNPANKLLDGRGQPGTHDVALGSHSLKQLLGINSSASMQASLPVYDKSLHSGLGDRLPQGRVVQGPLDCIIFEGWCMGFQSLRDEHLQRCYESKTLPNPDAAIRQTPLNKEYLRGPFFLQHELQSLLQVNQHLRAYEELWRLVDCFIQIEPEDMSYTWAWRLQQEHHMKSLNGGVGMSDEAVEAFVARYMPGYECFGGGIEQRWKNSLLRLVIGRERQVTNTSRL